jgi:hypothetical protein
VALAVEERVPSDLSSRNGPLLRRQPIEVENVGFAPGRFGGSEQLSEDFYGLKMQIEERIERAGGDLVLQA